jgi:N-acetylmuramic acid 6-phosphate etherase
VVCASGSALAELADLVVEVPVGPEVVAGSSRLKAASAQKLVLNAFSTTVMARRGRVLGNLMACLRVSNEKLRQRAAGICQAATGCDSAAARDAIERSDGVLEVALVMLARSVNPAAARAALDAAGGNLPEALGATRAK